jgi:hypothetical protein
MRRSTHRDAFTRSPSSHAGVSGRRHVSMLMLGDIRMDGRILRTTRALQQAGYRVTIFASHATTHPKPFPTLEVPRWYGGMRHAP